MQETWMWADEASGGVVAVVVDYDEQRIHVFDEPGCACGDSSAVQSLADFVAQGPRHFSPPEDIRQEMLAALRGHLETIGDD